VSWQDKKPRNTRVAGRVNRKLVLEALSEIPVTAHEIASYCEMERTQVYGILQAMYAKGEVIRTGGGGGASVYLWSV